MLFTVLNAIAFIFCLLAGVFLTADCLSEEKREGTLGLLFLTSLKGYDVVLGKSNTVIDASLDELVATPMAINVHESAQNLGKYVACGDIL